MEKKEVVSVVKCSSYKNELVRKALLQSLKNVDFHFKKGMKVLIKPNLLAPQKIEKAITTNPVLIEELCKILKEHNCKIYIGDSSAHDTDLALKICGIEKLSKYAEIVNFEGLPKRIFDFGDRTLDKIPLPKLLFEVDLIINFAKMKTHGSTGVTLCVKNLYGCIPGKLKEKIHKQIPFVKKFSNFLVALHEKIKPRLNFIDGVMSLEGEGPGASGKPKKTGILIASKSALAADVVGTEIMGFKANEIYTNKLSKMKISNIEKVGNAKDLKFKFERPSGAIAPFFMWINSLLPKSRICFDYDKCVKCGLCGRKCPVNAITFPVDYPKWCSKKCIRCLCCIEVCPHKAISLKDPFLKKVIKKWCNKLRKV